MTGRGEEEELPLEGEKQGTHDISVHHIGKKKSDKHQTGGELWGEAGLIVVKSVDGDAEISSRRGGQVWVNGGLVASQSLAIHGRKEKRPINHPKAFGNEA